MPGSVKLQGAFWTFLTFAGYSCIEKELGLFGDQTICLIRIPNQEVLSYFKACLLEDFSLRYGLSSDKAMNFGRTLLQGQVEDFEQDLRDLLEIVVGGQELFQNRIEAFYQGLILGMVAIYHDDYYLRSELPAGRGRGDLCLIPKTPQQGSLAVILEYKVGRSSRSLKKQTKEALDQIAKKHYLAECRRYSHITETLSVGLSFFKKNLALQSQRSRQQAHSKRKA